MKSFLSSFLLLLFLFPTWVMATDQPVGSIKTLNGEVVILRVNEKIQVKIGTSVFQGDVIQTSKSGSVGIIFRDDSIISVGPESTMNLKQYVFEPKNEKFSILMKMIKGTFVYISGAIGKLSPNSIRLETPSSIIGVRGTKMLVEVK
jgi:hypothetical protein